MKNRKHSIDLSGDSVTQQHFKESSDINNIVARYAQTGLDPYEDRKARERFGEATSQSYEEAMFTVAEIQSRFNELPATTRSKYHNDPSNLLDAFHDPEQQAELAELGLCDPVEEIVPPEPAQEPPEESEPSIEG